MQRAVGRPPAVSVSAATAALGQDLLGQEGLQLLAGVLESLPMAVAVRRVGPGCPVAAANDRFRLWLDSLSAAGGPDGASLTDEVTSLVTTAVRTGRSQHLQGLQLAAAGEAEGELPDAAACDVSVHPLRDTHGRVAHVVQAVRDVAAQPGTEEGSPDGEGVSSLRLRLDRMMALDKLKSDFMNLTTHELRSPLAIVYGYLSMMESGMLGELSGELREAVGSSIQSVELMMQLVTELVEMARLDETRLDPTREPVDLAGVVTEVAVRVESSERHHLRLDVGAGPAPVLGDRGAAPPRFCQPGRQRDQVLARRWRDRHPHAASRPPGRRGHHRPGGGHRPRRHGSPLHPLRPDRDLGHRGDRRHRPGSVPLPGAGPATGRRRDRHLDGGSRAPPSRSGFPRCPEPPGPGWRAERRPPDRRPRPALTRARDPPAASRSGRPRPWTVSAVPAGGTQAAWLDGTARSLPLGSADRAKPGALLRPGLVGDAVARRGHRLQPRLGDLPAAHLAEPVAVDVQPVQGGLHLG